jgi:putative toxin-antitoxin system antitoxin component (TIGR02293 family)
MSYTFEIIKPSTLPKLRQALKDGVPVKKLDEFQVASGLEWDEILAPLRLNSKLLAQRRKERRLSGDESERLQRLASCFQRAASLFEGDSQRARTWLRRPVDALSGLTPLELTDSEVGAREVESLIGRLEHGVFA